MSRMRLPAAVLTALTVLVAALLDCAAPVKASTPAACGAPKAAHVFFVTDREPADDAQLFSGERGLTKNRDAIVTRGVLGPAIDGAHERRCASQAAFLDALRPDFDPKRGRAVLLYVHGYYTTFQRAAQDALALQRSLRFNGPVVVYSWPSKVTSRLAYINDEANAGWSAIHFRELLTALLDRYPQLPVSFAAHSLGARFAGDAIDFLRHGRCAKCVGRALFFAPDVDGDTLRAALAGAGLCRGRPPTVPARAASVTLYVSNRDVALRQSQQLHGHQRAGQAGNEMLLCAGVDTIDVGYFKSSDKLGHSYHTDVRMGDDARAAFAGVSPASPSRKLVKAQRAGGTYYELR